MDEIKEAILNRYHVDWEGYVGGANRKGMETVLSTSITGAIQRAVTDVRRGNVGIEILAIDAKRDTLFRYKP